ncbi:MAG: lysine-sensitive aspartokinase 3, partial [Acidobacteriota bacterium]|nr:lysine-sensitive aspartokinase 3 [Acidobacteriota bacterium]
SGMATTLFDSRALIRTDDQHTQANPQLKETYANIRQALASVERGVVPVLGGFIGSTFNGVTTTLGRNSSNLTAVLLAGATHAEEVEIWTDVDGVFLHDPRQVREQFPLEELSFDDAVEIALRGARVLHLGAVLLARQENIPMWIKNSRIPEVPGTRITSQAGLLRTARMNVSIGHRAATSD